MTENETKADLIKKALIIVDELADLDYDEYEEMGELIDRAEKLKKHGLWKLK